jgi:hypothetical protein
MRYWLKLIGTNERKLGNYWAHEHPELLKCVRFREADDPSGEVEKGDKVVYCAADWNVVFATARVRSGETYSIPPARGPGLPIALDVFVEKKVDQLKTAPAADLLGLSEEQWQEKLRSSFIELDEEQFDRAARAID